MDIFIGGVLDRNTALHGDVVAALINPHDQWKVVYSQLDAFLEDHEEFRALVYKPVESNISYTDNASSSTLSDVHNTNVKSHKTNKTSDIISKINCDVVEEEKETDNTEHQDKKKKKHRRGRKKKSRKDVVEVLKDSFAFCIEESVADDSVDIISCPSKTDIDNLPKENALCSNPEGVVVVPPDQLSECDVSVGSVESVNSLTLEFETSMSVAQNSSVITHDNIFKSGIKYDKSQEIEVIAPNLTIIEVPDLTLFQVSSENVYDNSSNVKEIEDKPRSNKENEVADKVQKDKLNTNTSVGHKNLSTSKEANLPQGTKSKRTNTNTLKSDEENKPSVTQVMRLPGWEKFVQKTAKVVRIMERIHSMLAAGILKQFPDKNPHIALFSPFDNRIPRMKIQMQKCPPNFLSRPNDYLKVILLAKIVEWNEPKFAYGELCRDIGKVGDIDAETESLLLENAIDYSEFPESVMKDLPPLPWTIPEEEIKKRTDLRNSVIFTIDPATARDLDDAVSCLALPNGNFRIGVHIADASFFVHPDTELDKIAANRANSVYLVDRVIPMLPRPLCEELCSLNPGENRLAFSVIWELTADGAILGEWFGRSVIRSCVKLSYDHAQSVIENPDKILNPEEFPKISGGVSLAKIAWIIKTLHNLAVKLKERREQNGALRLNQLKLGFTLDPETKTPNGFLSQLTRESNWLIEEFMLLANISVAQKINSSFPALAMLRRHPSPHDVQLDNTVKFLSHFDINLDPTSSKTLNESIKQYSGTDPHSIARMQLIINLCSKPMQYAKYFCSGLVKPADQYHYALSVPCYTHFTSPIRRYADIIVHRLLAAAIDRENYPLQKLTECQVEQIADHCNSRKQAAKVISETNVDNYLSLFVRNVGEIIEKGMVIGVLDKSVDVLLLGLGIIKRCYMDKLPLRKFFNVMENKQSVIIMEWSEDPKRNLPSYTQRLTYFDCVNVILRPFENDALKVNAFLIRP